MVPTMRSLAGKDAHAFGNDAQHDLVGAATDTHQAAIAVSPADGDKVIGRMKPLGSYNTFINTARAAVATTIIPPSQITVSRRASSIL